MEAALAEEIILDDLVKSFRRYFGLDVLDAAPIKRGWLNLKWKVMTEAGEFMLKQYNKERFKLYKPEELLFAFSQQARMREQGLACPKLLLHEGEYLLSSENGERFMVMEFCQGKLIPPGKANVHQMYELGRMTGKMHWLLNGGTHGICGSPQFIPPGRDERLAHWDKVWRKAKEARKTELLGVIESQCKATEEIDMGQFEFVKTGWAHRDLWVDNLLFDDKSLTAILDFDRLKFDYPQLDVARAVLSCALDDDLDVSLTSAFMEGYREEHAAAEGSLAHSLQMLWYMESTWWIHSDMDQHSVPPARFAKEMIWLAANHSRLVDMLGEL